MESWILMLLWAHGFVCGILAGIFLERRRGKKSEKQTKETD